MMFVSRPLSLSLFHSIEVHPDHRVFSLSRNVNDLAQMDLSVLSCLGPDFDHQTVYHLLSSHGQMESVASSPCLKTNDFAHQSFPYIPRKRGSSEAISLDLKSTSVRSLVLVDQPMGIDDLAGSSIHPMKFSTSLPSFPSNQQNRFLSSSIKRPAAMANIAAHPYETPPPSMSTTNTDPAESVMEDASIVSFASVRLDVQWKSLCF